MVATPEAKARLALSSFFEFHENQFVNASGYSLAFAP